MENIDIRPEAWQAQAERFHQWSAETNDQFNRECYDHMANFCERQAEEAEMKELMEMVRELSPDDLKTLIVGLRKLSAEKHAAEKLRPQN